MAEKESKSLLIVDDSILNIDFLIGILGDDYRIAVALDGENALKLALRNSPDLILLDVIMPGIDGFEVCRRLKLRRESADIPILFTTALDDEESMRKIDASGAQGYVNKPFDREEILSKLKNIFL